MAEKEALSAVSPSEERKGSIARGNFQDHENLSALGYRAELSRNRSLYTLLFQSLAIAAVPFGEGSPMIVAIIGGGPLSIFVGWIVVCILDECVALSLGEIASRYPTSAGTYYWSHQLAKEHKSLLSFITAWIWLLGNWTITLSVNFGFASIISASVSMYHADFVLNDWQVLLVFYAITLMTLVICTFGNHFLPMVDSICAFFTLASIIAICISLSVAADAGRHSASYALGHYDTSLSGWGGFTFFIGLLPAAYTFSAIGMISSMAEEVSNPAVMMPKALSLCVPVGGIAGLFFILPICFTLPPLVDIINAPVGQALPYIFHRVMGSPGGGLALIFLVLVITLFCSISITVAASRATWAIARDDAIPGAKLFSKVNETLGVPVWALVLVTVVQLLLGLINLGSTSAFTAFVSVGVQALACSYAIPIAISLLNQREQVSRAVWRLPSLLGYTVNVIALAWIAFELVLFSMPTVLPVTAISMNYSSVIFVGVMVIAAMWYIMYARKHYKGPPASEGL